MHEPVPETSGPCANEIVSGALYQPFAFGCLSGVATVCGAVSSYLNPKTLAGLRLPARSEQVPLTEAVALSGSVYVTLVQVPASIPEVASVLAKPTGNERLYQPFASGADRPGVTVGNAGVVAS